MRALLLLALLFIGPGCGAPGPDGDAGSPAPAPGPPAEPDAPSTGRVLVLGNVEPHDPTEVIAGMQGMADLLASRLAHHGYTAGAVKIAADPGTMGRWMADGEVDLYFDSAYPASVVRDIAGARPVLRRWKRGAPEYHSIVFARADSGITSIADLGGRLMAFDDAASTSGYLLPIGLVLDAGLTPVPVTRSDAVVGAHEVACFFTGDDANVIEWVLAGRAAGGAVDSLTWEALIPEDTRAQLRVLATSDTYPRGYLMVRADLDPAVAEELRLLLLTVHQTDEGRVALDAMITTRFDEFAGDPDEALDAILELRGRVEPGPA